VPIVQENQHAEVGVGIAPSLRGDFGLLDLIVPEATLYFVFGYDGMTAGRLFLVQGPGYTLDLHTSHECLELVRNGYQAKVPLAHPSRRTGNLMTTILWGQTRLHLSISDRDGTREDTCNTPPSFPPHALREWARRQALAPNVNYESGEILYEAVLDQLQHLRDKIVDANAINGFWDIEYDGNKIVTRKPKHEPDILPQIRLLFYDLEIQKGLQVIPEYPTGAGSLDFLICGRTSANHVVKVCVEFKLAHAADLAHGFKVQLPEYMAHTATDYGIYCVLDFGSAYPANTSKFHIPGFNSDESSLDLFLSLAHVGTGRRYLRSLIIDVSKRVVPSKA